MKRGETSVLISLCNMRSGGYPKGDTSAAGEEQEEEHHTHPEGLLAIDANVGVPELAAVAPDLPRRDVVGVALADCVQQPRVRPFVIVLKARETKGRLSETAVMEETTRDGAFVWL